MKSFGDEVFGHVKYIQETQSAINDNISKPFKLR